MKLLIEILIINCENTPEYKNNHHLRKFFITIKETMQQEIIDNFVQTPSNIWKKYRDNYRSTDYPKYQPKKYYQPINVEKEAVKSQEEQRLFESLKQYPYYDELPRYSITRFILIESCFFYELTEKASAKCTQENKKPKLKHTCMRLCLPVFSLRNQYQK